MENGTLKSVPLEHIHISLGAKMVGFAGFNMPVRYFGDKEEHLTVRKGVGVFDVSHMGEFFIEGKGAFELVQHITSNDVAALSPGKIQYSCFPTENGGIVDDLLVYCYSQEKYMLVVNAGNIDKDWAWVNKHNTFGATLKNLSDEYALFAVQGPKATEAIAALFTSFNLAELSYYTFVEGNFAGIENVIVSATGYTGAGGFEVYVPKNEAEKAWNAIFEAGKAQDIKPIGLGARDTLRLEMGFCLYGNDIDETTSPLEAGLGWITKLNTNFLGSEYLKKQKEEGLTRKLVGFQLIDKGIARGGYTVHNESGETIGNVTSGTQSPSLGISIGMAYVSTANSKVGSKIFIDVRGKQLAAEVVKIPFLQKAN